MTEQDTMIVLTTGPMLLHAAGRMLNGPITDPIMPHEPKHGHIIFFALYCTLH